MPIFSDYDIEYSYYNCDALLRIQKLITENSTNKEDIRNIAFSDIDFNKVNHILDLGCAFGYSILGLKERIQPGTHIVGFDLQESYQKPFLKACRQIDANGEFHISDVAELATFPSYFFDLVISSFSMYFFPDSLAHIAAVIVSNSQKEVYFLFDVPTIPCVACGACLAALRKPMKTWKRPH